MTPQMRLFHAFWSATTDLVNGERQCRARAQAIEELIDRAQGLRRKIDDLPVGDQLDAELYLGEVERGLDDDQADLAIQEAHLAEIRKKRQRLQAQVWDITRDHVLGDLAGMS